MSTKKFVFAFKEGDGKNKKLLGGKRANLCEMTQIGLPVPPGFVITTEACLDYLEGKKSGLNPDLSQQIHNAMTELEKETGKKFGDPNNPLLVSVRSGAAMSMPGMMDTILNLGLNENSVKGLIAISKNERFVYDLYRRLIQLFGTIAMGLRDEDFNMEKNVILEEIGMYHDRPFWVAYEAAMEHFFGDHTLGHRVLGTNESVAALSRDQMADYFAEHYSPDNMIVSLAGRVDFARCVDLIAEHCGEWTPSGAKRNYQPAASQSSEQTIQRNGTTMHYVVGLSDGPSAQDESRYAAAVLAHILGDSDGSRLTGRVFRSIEQTFKDSSLAACLLRRQ